MVEQEKPFQGLDEFYAYKNQLLGDILTNAEILKLLDNQNVGLTPDDCVGTCVFPYEYLPTPDAVPIEKARTFICCDVDINNI